MAPEEKTIMVKSQRISKWCAQNTIKSLQVKIEYMKGQGK